jgi:hypothetical protein
MKPKIEPLIPPTQIPSTPIVKPKISPIFVGVVVGILFTAVASFAAYTLVIKPKLTSPSTPTIPLPSPSPVVTPLPTGNSVYGTLSWLSSPQKITNPEILTNAFSFAELGTYRVGKFSAGAYLLVTFVQPDGPSPPMVFRLIEDKGKFSLIESLISDSYVKKELDNIFNQKKISFISYQIKDLYPDDNYFVNQINFTRSLNTFSPVQFITGIKDFISIATTPAGDILSVSSPVTGLSDLSMRSLYLKLADFTLVPYIQVSSLASSDTKIPIFSYLDNTPNKNVYDTLHVGCGSGGIASIIKSSSSVLNDKVLIGKNNIDTEIFQIKSAGNPLVIYLYDQYKMGRDYPSAPPILTIDQFTAAPNHIIFQEKTGDWELLVSPDYSVQAECGKPVIYLYPTKDMKINIKVGADITQSKPLYPADGWTVLAHPGGQLDYQGVSYPNLFWEGKGWGIYPNLADYGFVVSQTDLIFTLKNHLKLLGLNARESADFMAFWTPKLPISPFVRLTWLNTADMNRLAPLNISPRPNTTIRIFLDFVGLNKPISLIPQKLSSIPRRGLTLIEWGGLLVK